MVTKTPPCLHGSGHSNAITHLRLGINWKEGRKKDSHAGFLHCLHNALCNLSSHSKFCSPEHTSAQGNRKKELKPYITFHVWVAATKVTSEYLLLITDIYFHNYEKYPSVSQILTGGYRRQAIMLVGHWFQSMEYFLLWNSSCFTGFVFSLD